MKCPFCEDGKIKLPAYFMEIPIGKGIGKTEVEVDCSLCKGTGKIEINENKNIE